MVVAVVGAVLAVVVLVAAVAVLLNRPEDPVVIAASTRVSTTRSRPSSTTTSVSTTVTTRPRTTTTSQRVLWTSWSPADRSFTIDFTGTPTVQQLAGDGQVVVKAAMASVQTASSIHVVGWYDLSSERYAADSAAVLNAIADSYIRDTGLDVGSRGLGHWAGNPSLEFAGTLTKGAQSVEVRALAIVAGVRVFLFVAGDDGGGSSDFEHFRDSFRIHG